MIDFLVRMINLLSSLIVLLVIVNAILSYFLDPYHPLRSTLDRIVAPLLAPIRRVLPLVGMFDLSPLVLIILVQILAYALTAFLYSL